MHCPECESELRPRARFCHKCGWDAKLAAAGKASSTAANRPAWKRWLMSVTLAISAALVLMLMLVARTDAVTTPTAGEPAPGSYPPLSGGGRVELADLKGKPVVINFWASWCTPCLKEMPDFQAIYDKYKDQGLELYGINVGESKVAVNLFKERVGTNFPLLIDEGDQAQNDYKTLPPPAALFCDGAATIRAL